jgi:FkbM family methyltransferase
MRGEVAYDLGANYGLYSLLMARLVTSVGRVYAFEPVPAIYADLVRNVQLNQFNHIKCVCKAVSDRTGTGRFILGHHAGAGHLASGGRGGVLTKSATESFDVEETTLDEFVRRGGLPPTFIKVDVEGSEASVLRGARMVLAEHRPLLLIELHTPEQDVAVGAVLKEAGYHARRVKKGAPPVLDLSTGWPDPHGMWGHILGVPTKRAGRAAM